MPDTDTRRIALVTGASRGIGRSTVLTLAERGVDVIATYNTNADKAREVETQADALPGRVVFLALDQADTSTFDDFVASVRSELEKLHNDRIDYLVNNAGIWLTASFEDTTEEELDQQYAVNFKGVFFLTQKLLPLIRDEGRILNTSSGLTRFTFPNKIGYGSIKGALEPYTRYLAMELADRGIRVNAIAPGATATDFSGGVIRDDPKYRDVVSGLVALGRPGIPEEIGPMVAALLSDDAKWVNGERIEISGGMKL